MTKHADQLDLPPFPTMDWSDCDWWEGVIDLAIGRDADLNVTPYDPDVTRRPSDSQIAALAFNLEYGDLVTDAVLIATRQYYDGVRPRYVDFLDADVVVTEDGKDIDSLTLATKQIAPVVQSNGSSPSVNFALEGADEIPFSRRSGETTIEGVLKGTWLRLQSGETLGDLSKVTLLDPLRLVVGDQSLPLLGGTEELEQTLLKNTGRTVRLTGHLMRCIEDGRSIQNLQAGYTGAIPAHVIQFLTVSECEVFVTGAK